MRFLAESQVPERVRLQKPLPVTPPPAPVRPASPTMADVMPDLLQAITKIVQDAKPAPVVVPPPIAPPAPTKEWKFTIHRNEDGLITDITAKRMG